MFSFRKSRRRVRSDRRVTPTVQLGLEQLESREVLSPIAVASPSQLFVIRPDQSVWANLGSGWSPITSAGFAASINATSEISTGQAVLFALTPGGTLFQWRLLVGWTLVGSTFKTMSAGTDLSGNADVFALTPAGSLFLFNNSGVFNLGSFVTSISASNNGIVFATLSNNAVWAFDPTLGWFALTAPGFSNQVTASTDLATGNEVVFADTLGGTVFQWTLATGWSQLGSTFTTISAGRDNTGIANVYALTSKSSLFEFDRNPVRALFVGNFVSDMQGTNNNRVFVILSNGAVWGHDATFGWFPETAAGFAMP